LSLRDRVGTIGARTGVARNSYKITPGLYAVGSPGAASPIVVTANYKLTFDTVRVALATLDVWLLVVDTRGINVWCAAGKGTFSAEEVAYQISRARLHDIVTHRKVILPQLAAVGVNGQKVYHLCSFKAVFGPVRSEDLAAFINDTVHDKEEMRSVTFRLTERLVLIPVEVCLLYKPLLGILFAAFLLSGIGPDLFSAAAAMNRGWQFILATGVAVFAGAIVTPVLLPWIPGRRFWVKGIISASICGGLFAIYGSPALTTTATLALVFWILAGGSYLAMNFTGSTPYTSLAGVEAEMRTGLAVQITLAAFAIVLWLITPFTSGGQL